MIEQTDLAGSFTLPGTSMTVNRWVTVRCNSRGEMETSWYGGLPEMSMEQPLFCERLSRVA
jgi:hypothetical protein